ncbi:MAG: patatin-like phospholipase family protein [Pseudomonadota bacterium]
MEDRAKAQDPVGERLRQPGRKRILSLDGGGIRGLMTLQVLRRVEALVEEAFGHKRLCDHFDLIGGTSTGAIIAAALATGHRVDDVEAMYDTLGTEIFRTRWYRKGVIAPKFGAAPLRQALVKFFKEETTLGSAAVQTGLAVVAKRLNTGSVWVIHNARDGKYWRYNQEWPLHQLVRTSAAAPHYFAPEEVMVKQGQQGEPDQWGEFVDGGVSPHNNPSLQLLFLATLQGHGLRWNTEQTPLSIMSLGTGLVPFGYEYQHRTGWSRAWHAITHPKETASRVAGVHAGRSLVSLMQDNAQLIEQTMQWIAHEDRSRYRHIDNEVGTLAEDRVPGLASPSPFYVRYDVSLDRDSLNETIASLPKTHGDHPPITDAHVKMLRAMDDPAGMTLLKRIGQALAAQVKVEHLQS